MAVTDYSVKNTKVFPELLMLTATQAALPTGNTDIFKIFNINQRTQSVKPLQFSAEAVDNITVTPVVDGQNRYSLNGQSLPGISGSGTDVRVESPHYFDFAKDRFIMTANNSTGGTSANWRARIQFIIDALTSADKYAHDIPLAQVDQDAISTLKRRALPIDFDRIMQLGIGVPPNFDQFLAIHQVKKGILANFPTGTNLATTDTFLVNEKVANVGKEAIVLESIWVQAPVQTNQGQVLVKITRDEDVDFIKLDPACFTGTMQEVDLHIHAFDTLQVNILKSAGTYTNYQAFAGMSVRNIGIAFKAKLAEFLGGVNNLPKQLDISSAEQRIIDDMNLRELARTGVVAL